MTVLFAWACQTLGSWADPPRANLPDPLYYVDPACVSFGVLQARPGDAAFHQALQSIWSDLEAHQFDSSSWLGVLTAVLGSTQKQQFLLGFLPFQGVRLDYLDPQGQAHSATVVTITGWPGLQGLFWNRLQQDGQGNPWPTRRLGKVDVVLRGDGAIARLDRTFYAFSDAGTAQRCLLPHSHALSPAYQKLDRHHDTYGLLFNRHNSLRRFLGWLDQDDLAAVEKAQGPARFQKTLESIEMIRWQGELLDEDRLRLTMQIQSQDSPAVEELLSIAQRILSERGRPARLQTAASNGELCLQLEIGGNRKFIVDYLTRDKPI